MSFIKEDSGLPVVTTPPCVYLRNKAMFVRNVVGDPDNFPADSTAGACWCNQTQQYRGPDNQYVTRHECIPGRECYRETY
jgi:hypothetical protein